MEGALELEGGAGESDVSRMPRPYSAVGCIHRQDKRQAVLYFIAC